ncbi:MAG: RHS repeat protein [Acidobacteria bacterium]|nr:RHS repeat protein [Acidobacteriota bacterium]MCA1641753.1 RHS repeat protein [Acidobacteriota bacterium]
MQKLPLSVALLVIASCAPARAQTSRPRADTKRRGSEAPLVFLDSTRERDGLKGPVHRVETEVVRLDFEHGARVEKSRSVLERTLYDEGGRRVENETYPVVGATRGGEVHSYDAQGNLAETVVRDARGATLSRTTYEYEFDAFGNWVKMTASVAVTSAGKSGYEPVEVTNRTITYYRIDDGAGAKAPAAAGAQVSSASEVKAGAERAASHAVHAVDAKPREAPRAAAAVGREINVGVLNDRATSVPKPAFVVTEKRLDVPVTVSVEVVVDPTGRVVEATAQNGPKALREAAEASARRATFMPFYSEGRPVRARGRMNFGFYFAP